MPELETVVITLCSACLDGTGGECHVPGCALWMNRAPDVAIRDKAADGFTDKERDAVLHIIGKLAKTGGECGWTTINGARVDALASATAKLNAR